MKKFLEERDQIITGTGTEAEYTNLDSNIFWEMVKQEVEEKGCTLPCTRKKYPDCKDDSCFLYPPSEEPEQKTEEEKEWDML